MTIVNGISLDPIWDFDTWDVLAPAVAIETDEANTSVLTSVKKNGTFYMTVCTCDLKPS